MVSESPRRALSNDINIVGEFVELKKLLSKTTIFGGGHFFLSHTVHSQVRQLSYTPTAGVFVQLLEAFPKKLISGYNVHLRNIRPVLHKLAFDSDGCELPHDNCQLRQSYLVSWV